MKGIAQINPDGSGLGLYIAKKLSEAHNGGVWVESKGKGKGSSFCLWVPAYAKASAGEPASPELSRGEPVEGKE